jgi:hypothetical protein
MRIITFWIFSLDTFSTFLTRKLFMVSMRSSFEIAGEKERTLPPEGKEILPELGLIFPLSKSIITDFPVKIEQLVRQDDY